MILLIVLYILHFIYLYLMEESVSILINTSYYLLYILIELIQIEISCTHIPNISVLLLVTVFFFIITTGFLYIFTFCLFSIRIWTFLNITNSLS